MSSTIAGRSHAYHIKTWSRHRDIGISGQSASNRQHQSAPLSMGIPVIIDTDPGVDDVIAILLALSSPELNVLAIIISFGNTSIEASHLNIVKLYDVLQRHLSQYPGQRSRFPGLASTRKVILAKGASGPIAGQSHTAEYFHGRDGLGDIAQRHPELNVELPPGQHPHLQLTDRPGAEVALELIRREPSRSVTYIALGPLTDLAQLMRIGGSTVRDRIGRIVCMGGALDVPGNTSPVAEFNFFADPCAVHELLTGPSPALPLNRFLLLPLDITTPHELPFPAYAAQVDSAFSSAAAPSQAAGKPPLVHFTSAFLERTREVMVSFGKDAMELHDIVAVWCATANPPVEHEAEGDGAVPRLQPGWRAMRRKFQIERVGELTRGMCVVDRRDDPGAYAPGANRSEVQAELEQQNLRHTGAFESTALPAQVEVETAGEAHPPASGGVACVYQTPGHNALLKLLLERVWGVAD